MLASVKEQMFSRKQIEEFEDDSESEGAVLLFLYYINKLKHFVDVLIRAQPLSGFSGFLELICAILEAQI